MKESVALPGACNSREPVCRCLLLIGRQRAGQDKFSGIHPAASLHHAGKFAKDGLTCRVEVEDAVYKCDGDRSIRNRQAFGICFHKQRIPDGAVRCTLAGAGEHGIAEINSDDSASGPCAPGRYKRVQARSTTQVKNRRARWDVREDGNVGHARESINAARCERVEQLGGISNAEGESSANRKRVRATRRLGRRRVSLPNLVANME
jgi:hypothetical protein